MAAISIFFVATFREAVRTVCERERERGHIAEVCITPQIVRMKSIFVCYWLIYVRIYLFESKHLSAPASGYMWLSMPRFSNARNYYLVPPLFFDICVIKKSFFPILFRALRWLLFEKFGNKCVIADWLTTTTTTLKTQLNNVSFKWDWQSEDNSTDNVGGGWTKKIDRISHWIWLNKM